MHSAHALHISVLRTLIKITEHNSNKLPDSQLSFIESEKSSE